MADGFSWNTLHHPKFGSRKAKLVPELVEGSADVGDRPFDKLKNRSPIG